MEVIDYSLGIMYIYRDRYFNIKKLIFRMLLLVEMVVFKVNITTILDKYQTNKFYDIKTL